jgi:1,4-dihydroxy-2-naphthoate octaprenyltransferase
LWLVLACQVGFFATAIMTVNNIRDRATDALAHKRTTVVRFGVVFGRFSYATLVLTPYVLVLMTKWYLNDSDVTLLPIMTLPLVTSQLQAVSGGEVDGPNLNPHVGGTARVQFLFCILQAASLYLYHQQQQNQMSSSSSEE